MISDKNIDILEKQLKTLGKKIRIDILKVLYHSSIPLPFSVLQKEIIETNSNKSNFSFHLNSLKNIKLITSESDGYVLTNMGKKIMKNILSIEQVINDQNKTIMIRTSKYSKEPFNVHKIEDYLMKEGEIDELLACKIANEVKSRIFKSEIEYLTAPLMREYINAILLEQGLEDIRHKLTRLGTPPYEVFKLFDSQINLINPEQFIRTLGTDVSEQFLLLNLLPKDLADLYITGEIDLLNLNSWGLRPLGFYVNSQSILDLIFSENPENLQNNRNSRTIINFILKFIDKLDSIYPYISGDLLLGNFNKNFLSLFYDININKLNTYFDIFKSQISKYNAINEDIKSHLSLDFVYDEASNVVQEQFEIDHVFLDQYCKESASIAKVLNPLFLFDYVNFKRSNNIFPPHLISNHLVFYNKVPSNLINSSVIKVRSPSERKQCENKIILDKIFINLELIARKANNNDDFFHQLLQEKMLSVFSLFSFKESLVSKKLDSLKSWRLLYSELFSDNFSNWTRDSIKSISFFGLNEAINYHCGIDLDRTLNSELFALEIMNSMGKIIEEKNDEDGSNFILTQPHNNSRVNYSLNSKKRHFNGKYKIHSGKILRNDTLLSLNEKITIFKKFERVIKGGVKFSCNINSDDEEILREHIDILTGSKLHAFSLNLAPY